MKIVIKNGILSFADLFKPKSFEAGGDLKYSANIIVGEDTEIYADNKLVSVKKLLKLLAAMYEDRTKTKFNKNIPIWMLNKADGSTTRNAYISQKTGEYYGGVDEDTWYFSASVKEENSPNGKIKVLDQLGEPCTANDGKIYAGCVVAVILDAYAYNGKSKGISATLLGVKKLAEGERLGGQHIDVMSELDAIKGEVEEFDIVEADETGDVPF